MCAVPFNHRRPTPNDPPMRRVRVRRPVTPKVAPKATVRGPSHKPLLTQRTFTDAHETAQALGSGKKSSPGSGSARGSPSVSKAASRSTPKSSALAGLDDTAANSPRAAPAAAAGAVAVDEVEVSLEGMSLEAPASQDPKQRVLSQVNLSELPGTAGAGAEEARQILAGAFPALVSLFMLYSRVGSECVTLAEATTLGLEGFRKLLKDAPSLEVVGMGADAMGALFARCLTGQPQPALIKKPVANKAGAAPLKAGAATKKDKPEDAGPPPIPPEQVQLQLSEFLSLLTRLSFLKANPRYGKKDPKGSAAPEVVPVPTCLRKFVAEALPKLPKRPGKFREMLAADGAAQKVLASYADKLQAWHQRLTLSPTPTPTLTLAPTATPTLTLTLTLTLTRYRRGTSASSTGPRVAPPCTPTGRASCRRWAAWRRSRSRSIPRATCTAT